ncbi:MAG: DUF501 domain-containing protein [Actinomycetota bacterium]|nr:DUF501 domain-containing protein [Actinomycetota bacterium]
MDDRSVVTIQMGRPPRSEVHVALRCALGLPVVIDVPPILDDGTPFPTTHWLTCPLAKIRIARLEADGGVREADESIASDPELAEEFAAAMRRYEEHRSGLIPDGWDGPLPSGGIAGSKGGVKCLHAQYADTAAGNENPVGRKVACTVEPLDCTLRCVVETRGEIIRNEQWVEPA